MAKHQQFSHLEATVMSGMFATVQPANALTDAIERMDDDARGLARKVALQKPDVAHQVYLSSLIAQ